MDRNGSKSTFNKESELFRAKDLDLNYLPLNSDVISYVYLLKNKSPYHKKINSLFDAVVKDIANIWKKTGISIISRKNLINRIEKLFKKYKQAKRKIHEGKDHQDDLSLLSNIFNATHCKCANFIMCECSFKTTISEAQYRFVLN